jgi:hypothetical protein
VAGLDESLLEKDLEENSILAARALALAQAAVSSGERERERERSQ